MLARVAVSLPPDTYLRRVQVSRTGTVTVDAMGVDPVAFVQSLAEWWGGQVALAAYATPSEPGAVHPFTVVLDGAR